MTLLPSAALCARFRDVPRAQLAAAGQEVLSLPDAEVTWTCSATMPMLG
ncbi:hypothetical protein WMF04_01270 [Sorangium sp. So ce260]